MLKILEFDAQSDSLSPLTLDMMHRLIHKMRHVKNAGWPQHWKHAVEHRIASPEKMQKLMHALKTSKHFPDVLDHISLHDIFMIITVLTRALQPQGMDEILDKMDRNLYAQRKRSFFFTNTSKFRKILHI